MSDYKKLFISLIIIFLVVGVGLLGYGLPIKTAQAATATYTYKSPIVVQNPAGATSAAAYYGDDTITPSAMN